MVDGAAVRVSIICFAPVGNASGGTLNGLPVSRINADLTGGTVDLTKSARLAENRNVAFMGDTKGGAFDISADLARQWLVLPLNPNGLGNAKVLRPWMNGMDVTRRSADKWIIDFGWRMDEEEAALFDMPYKQICTKVKPEREKNNRETYRRNWWRHVESRQGMWAVLADRSRYIVTPRVAKHRLFVWLQAPVCPDSQLIVIARDDDTTFGVLHSRFHEAWSLRLGTSLEDRPRYTPSTTFETFPFPEGLAPNIPAKNYEKDPRAVKIATVASRLDELRKAWLNSSDLVEAYARGGAGLSRPRTTRGRQGGGDPEKADFNSPLQ